MKRFDWWQSWPRIFLWSHVIGVVGFYGVNWWRTAPRKNDVAKVLPPSQYSQLQPPQSGSEQREIPQSTSPLSSVHTYQKEMVASAPGRESTVLSEDRPLVSIIVPARNE